MRTIHSMPAYYPTFEIGCRPQVIRCELRLVEADAGAGPRRFIKTPFAMLDAQDNLDPAEQLRALCERYARGGFASSGFYTTAPAAQMYLDEQYPRAKEAEPIMDHWWEMRHYHGPIVGDSRTADDIEVSSWYVSGYARGQRMVSVAMLKDALAALQKNTRRR